MIPQRIKDYADIESPAYKDAIKQLFDDGYYRDNRRHLYSESIDTDDFEVYVFDKSNANLRKGVIGQICIVYGISDTYVKKGKRLIKKPYRGMYGQHATDFNKTYWDLNPTQKRDHMGIYTLSIYDSSMIAQ